MLQRGAETGKSGPESSGVEPGRLGDSEIRVIRHRIGGPDWESKSGDTRQGVWPGESSGGKLSTRFIRFFRPFSGQQKEASEGRRDKGRGSAQNQVGEITQAHSRDKLAGGKRSSRLIRFFRRSRAGRRVE
jgi:hypothetical protein